MSATEWRDAAIAADLCPEVLFHKLGDAAAYLRQYTEDYRAQSTLDHVVDQILYQPWSEHTISGVCCMLQDLKTTIVIQDDLDTVKFHLIHALGVWKENQDG